MLVGAVCRANAAYPSSAGASRRHRRVVIVLARFVFAYEQTFMGDLVRFWYAALFLFASAYTLKEDAHVRVDVFYAGYQADAVDADVTGTVAFGLLPGWLILVRGMEKSAYQQPDVRSKPR